MRSVVVAVIAIALCACADHNGTYLVVDGEDANIEFDEVEFYFGEHLPEPFGQGSVEQVPTTPNHAERFLGEAYLAKRIYSRHDRHAAPSRGRILNYYLPSAGENLRLGTYVLVVAYLQGAPVGVGELSGFRVDRDDAIYLYGIELEPFDPAQVEMWGGRGTDCVRWTRSDFVTKTERTVAVVYGHDYDCDSFPNNNEHSDEENVDCEPFLFCDGTGTGACLGTAPCVWRGVMGQCQVAACANTAGQPSCGAPLCLDDDACAGCDLDAPIPILAECAIAADQTHIDEPIILMPDGSLCAEPFGVLIALSERCKSPRIEGISNFGTGIPFLFQVSESGVNCLVEIRSPAAGTPYTSVAHVLISYESTAYLGVRVTFTAALLGAPAGGACPNEQTIYDIDLGECPPPRP